MRRSFSRLRSKLPLRGKFYFICCTIHCVLYISNKIFLRSLANIPIIKMPFHALTHTFVKINHVIEINEYQALILIIILTLKMSVER